MKRKELFWCSFYQLESNQVASPGCTSHQSSWPIYDYGKNVEVLSFPPCICVYVCLHLWNYHYFKWAIVCGFFFKPSNEVWYHLRFNRNELKSLLILALSGLFTRRFDERYKCIFCKVIVCCKIEFQPTNIPGACFLHVVGYRLAVLLEREVGFHQARALHKNYMLNS